MAVDVSLPLAFDIPEGLIPVIFVVLYTIAQLVGNREPKPQAKRVPRQRPELPKPDKAQAGGGGQQGNLEDALRREVDAFLKRASGGGERPEKRPAKSQPQPAPPRRQPLAETRRPEPTPQPPAAQPPAKRPVLARSEAQPLPMPASSLRETSVAEHVSRHIGASSTSIAQQISHLGEQVGLADDRLEEHLREKFDHKLGSLRRQEVEPVPAEEEGSLAAEIRQTLSSPAGVRQFIIANEILNRPESRW